MTATERQKLNQLGKAVYQLTSDVVDIKRRLDEREERERKAPASGAAITLADMKQTVKVLENYKSQGIKRIDLV